MEILYKGKTIGLVAIIIALSFLSWCITVPYAAALPSISFQFGSYTLGDGAVGLTPVIITVTDSTANLNPVVNDTVQVHVTSTTDPTGIDLTLSETNVNTGIFKNTDLIFMKNNYQFSIGNTDTVTIIDYNANASSTVVNQLPLQARSSSDHTGISVSFSETGVNTGVFSGKIAFTSSASSGNNLHVIPGDIFSITDLVGGLTTNGIIIPNSNPTVGAIRANIGDTVIASYGIVSTSITIQNDETVPGGGGGGLIRPGLVLDIIAGIGGSPYVVQPPSFGGLGYHFADGLIFTQGNNKTIHDISHYNQELPRQVMVAGDKVNMTFKTYESYNSEGVIHMGLYLIPRGHDMITPNNVASIEWNKGEPAKIKDPDNILSYVNTSSRSDGKFQYTQFVFTPTKSYEKMSFLVRAWNDHRYTTDARIHDAIDMQQSINSVLPYGTIKYDKFSDLQSALYHDQFYKPEILAHIHDKNSVFPSQGGKVYWLYDTVNHFVTLVVSDENDNKLFSQASPLQPYAIEKKGDYKFMYFTVKQLDRWDTDQIQKAMKTEEEKALSVALEKRIMPQSKW